MSTNKDHFHFYNGVLVYPILLVLCMWIVFWIEVKFGYNFTSWGIRPQSIKGLRGIFFSPFIHSSLDHLWHNSVPVFVLTTALFYFYKNISWQVFIWLMLLSGLGTWLIGRTSFHIGMSGLVYALASFLFFKGICSKHFRLVALSLLVVFLYGSLIWGTLPLDEKISWEGHLSGFIAGILALVRFRESVPLPSKYSWEEIHYEEENDPFMRQFDEDGNFFELPNTEEIESSESNKPPQEVVYIFKPSSKDDD
ncbi:rhomboid family intramembrane serine protease [Dokdonia sp. Hel_I_53]|uniref:rhomboid family intramembrane serine protease n=1 Tax=Dokdonia sp. Hel_I_53 TaxID=1566287 RepID=UPI001199CA87|nr:rhomboid family intramembrane serine protease [Dokdonia sp. Hel_I_53]TVZ52062.1 membrane associated rhomboid family serine protease [Dokdonia sp. Hel_I_53]